MKIKENIYSVGVLNPTVRVADIIVAIEFGTTYNSYLIKGSEKTALIDTVHPDFFEDHIKNIEAITDIKNIDYIVINHTEPDHSGSLAKLLEINPDITVIASTAGQKYVSQIVNRKFNSIIAKDGDTVSLGDKTLKFINAPFLHWPDSMFTYIEEDSALFTCDFLGAHFCGSSNIDTKLLDTKIYFQEFKNYYDVIMSPFKEHVLNGLNKIANLKFDMICPSHGPLLTVSINAAISSYRQWSEALLQKNEIKKVFILYASAYGCTAALAAAIRDGIAGSGKFDIEVNNVLDLDLDEIREKVNVADAIVLGSPTLNRDAVKPVWDALNVVDAINSRGKVAGAFGSYGWSGEAVKMLIDRMNSLRLKTVGEGVRAKFVPSADEIKAAFEYGEEIAKNLLL